MQRQRFPTLSSAQAEQQPLWANLRLKTTQQALRAEATQNGNATWKGSKGDYTFSLYLHDGL
jgi:hypothetical protein